MTGMPYTAWILARCSTIRSSYLADKVEELKSICWCGNKAHMNARVAGSGEVLRDGAQVEIGGHDKYVSLCRKHYLQGLAFKPALL